MTAQAATSTPARERRVPVALRGANVTETFRDNLFDAANRAGMTANEYVLQAAAEKLKASGRQFSGLFRPGDISMGAH
ncbi:MULTISPECIES: hypothetical protein [unclassified Rhizobium]|uniref:hypothetical protein n=1 Tax=unclassified Rhizobium TaxID=2613769 RepID=UPI00115DF1E9|nr:MULTISPECIES: hypothetical protein [unclassified Rhizobium]TQX88445.1 hypothetical protein EQW76_11450 [Rhizobium sp. rho-13.1]TQY12640.1 hypothetical protein EQW74_15095 [Rhizobium sp. rho-1.1]